MTIAPFGRLKEGYAVEVNSFSNGRIYLSALLQTPRRLLARMGATWTPEAELVNMHNTQAGTMKRDLHWFDLLSFGIGAVVGGGIFISSGEVARDLAGPAVVISFVIAGVAALLSAMCFAEFAVEVPSAGGAYSYIRIAFGEFISFLAGISVFVGGLAGAPAVARAFTSYLCTVFGNTDANAWRIHVDWLPNNMNYVDLPAVGVLFILTVICCWSTKESSTLNIVTTIVHIAFIVFIIVAGFIYGKSRNLVEASDSANPSGFFPFGLTGIFTGASVAFFSYTGFDSVATLAEECQNPGLTLPLGIVGSIVISIIMFCLMLISLLYLQPYDLINSEAPYTVAFAKAGIRFATQIVGVGAVLGALTSTFATVIAVGRYLTAMGRSFVIPSWFAHVNSRTGTPINAQLSAFVIMAFVGLLVESTVSMTINSVLLLFVYGLVSASLIVYRYRDSEGNSHVATFVYLIIFTVTSIVFFLVYHFAPSRYVALIALGFLCFIETFAFSVMFAKPVHPPHSWGVPCMPYFASASVFVCIFLIGSFSNSVDGNPLTVGVCTLGFASLLYVFYGVHASWDNQFSMKPIPQTEMVES